MALGSDTVILSLLNIQLMERGTKMVLEQVVTTIASVADAAEENFIEYYDRFIPCLMYIIENANSVELRLLRGKTIECVSLIGLAVGPDKVSCVWARLPKGKDWESLSNFSLFVSRKVELISPLVALLGASLVSRLASDSDSCRKLLLFLFQENMKV